MKNILYLLSIISLLSCKNNSMDREQTIPAHETNSAEETQNTSHKGLAELKTIDDIKIEHAYITEGMEKGGFNSTSFDYNCNEEKKGKLTYFYEEDELRLIRHEYNEYSHFSATDEYFIKDGAAFFVFYDHLAWNFSGYNQTQDKITEKRFYILNNQPVMCLAKNFSVNSRDENPPGSDQVANKEIECPSIKVILEDFNLLYRLREQEGNMECLENI